MKDTSYESQTGTEYFSKDANRKWVCSEGTYGKCTYHSSTSDSGSGNKKFRKPALGALLQSCTSRRLIKEMEKQDFQDMRGTKSKSIYKIAFYKNMQAYWYS